MDDLGNRIAGLMASMDEQRKAPERQSVSDVSREAMMDVLHYQERTADRAQKVHEKLQRKGDLDDDSIREVFRTLLEGQVALMSAVSVIMQDYLHRGRGGQ